MIYPFGTWSGPILSRGEGIHVFSDQGKRFVDLTSGFNVANIGYSHPQVLDAIRQHLAFASYLPASFENSHIRTLESKLLALFGGEYDTVLRATTGTEAVDIAIQVAMHSRGRKKVICLEHSYHGNSHLTRKLCKKRGNRTELVEYAEEIILLKHPYFCKDESERRVLLEAIRQECKKQEAACCVIEGITTCGGSLLIDPFFMHELGAMLRENGIFLIFDEVGTGFGRTGKTFAFEHFDVNPDFVCLAKGLGGGYAPIAAVMTRQGHMKDFYYYSTFAWQPLAAIIASSVLDVIAKNRLAERAQSLGKHALETLLTLLATSPYTKDVRGLGMEITIELSDAAAFSYVMSKSLEQGLIVADGILENTVLIMPPLVITTEELDESLEKLAQIIVAYKPA